MFFQPASYTNTSAAGVADYDSHLHTAELDKLSDGYVNKCQLSTQTKHIFVLPVEIIQVSLNQS